MTVISFLFTKGFDRTIHQMKRLCLSILYRINTKLMYPTGADPGRGGAFRGQDPQTCQRGEKRCALAHRYVVFY